MHLENGISTQRAIETSSWQLGEGAIVDMKIFDDQTLFLLWEHNGTVASSGVQIMQANDE